MDVPCFGCGLTRSFCCTIRGMFEEALAYHPFGPLLVAICLAIVVVSLLPRGIVDRLHARIDGHRRSVNAVIVLIVAGLIVHGLMRGFLYCLG